MPISLTRVIGAICMFAQCGNIFEEPRINTNPIPEVRNEATPPTLVHIPHLGGLRGFEMKTLQGRKIAAFQGIRYAEAPIGERRFKEAEPYWPWNCTKDFIETPPVCVQMDPTRYYNVVGEEDCLFLNIYVPPGASSKRKKTWGEPGQPVIVWIHGGSFYWGAGSHYGPSYLLDYDRDAILVTLNYRLGPLGFFSTGDDRVPGNLGLKDQALAIKWVKENIEYFGGDPNNLSLMGHSAGAASVHLQMMGPVKNLFQKAISQSGTALSMWALSQGVKENSFKLAKIVGCGEGGNRITRGIHDEIECLRKVPATELAQAQYQLFEWMEHPSTLFTPVIEHVHPKAFLTKSPEELYKHGQVAHIPWTTGVTSDEGDLAVLASYIGPMGIQRMFNDFDSVMPIVLMYNRSDTQMTKDIRNFYFGEFKTRSFHGMEMMGDLGEVFGDRFFYAPFHKTLRMHSQYVRAPLYAYLFSYKGRQGPADKFQLQNSQWGVMHLDELQYIFNSTEIFKPMEMDHFDYPIVSYMTDLWTNFAKNGMPLMKRASREDEEVQFENWEPFTLNRRKLLEINVNSGMVMEPYMRRVNFWKKHKYY